MQAIYKDSLWDKKNLEFFGAIDVGSNIGFGKDLTTLLVPKMSVAFYQNFINWS